MHKFIPMTLDLVPKYKAAVTAVKQNKVSSPGLSLLSILNCNDAERCKGPLTEKECGKKLSYKMKANLRAQTQLLSFHDNQFSPKIINTYIYISRESIGTCVYMQFQQKWSSKYRHTGV